MFGVFGYLSVALAAGAVLLWLVHWMMPDRRLVNVALLLALLACAGARLNSAHHVDRIELDPAGQLAAAKTRQDQRRQAALDSRGGEVADIRFAEDAEGEYYDRAGMDEADLKYLEGGDAKEAGWKNARRERGGDAAGDDSLEELIGAKETQEGVKTDAIEARQNKPAILMSAGGLSIANKLDRWNLNLSLALVVIGILMLALDYLRRANLYQEASLPLPLPSGLRNAVTPLPALVERPPSPRRSLPEELLWLMRRGESFVVFTEGRLSGDEVMAELEPLAAKSRHADLIRPAADGPDICDEFIFEALWHGRASFVVDDPARAGRMIVRFIELLQERRALRARVRQSAHLVWNVNHPMPEATRDALVRLASATGLSLFLCHKS